MRPVTDITVEGLPVHGDIVACYAILQRLDGGKCWVVMGCRAIFDYCWEVIVALDPSQPTRIVYVRHGKVVNVVRSWN